MAHLVGFLLSSLQAIDAEWIWSQPMNEAQANEVVHFRKPFTLNEIPSSASIYASCDNILELWINGKKVTESDEWSQPVQLKVKKFLRRGKNIIAVRGKNDGGNMAGLIVELRYQSSQGQKSIIKSDKSWRMKTAPKEEWQAIEFDDQAWSQVVSLGKYGISPWGKLGEGQKPTPPGQVTAPEDLNVADGFKVELVYNVPKASQGSWVALTKDNDGRLIVSDQGGQGLYRITLTSAAPIIDKIDVDLSGAQGLLWAFDSLYVHRSGRGLYRVTDSDGDDQLDTVIDLKGPNGGGEHGNHAVILSEDGNSLYVDAGNHTNVPSHISKSRIGMNWSEDLLLPRQWDANGHARGRMAPGGWVAKVSPDGSDWEIYSIGYRNQYDLAINRHGDMFTYDADMEWDMGSPWYRPTRICQVVSGSEFGWRSGTGKWPSYYEDSLPAVVDIGPGSPTGTVTGVGARFPTKYQDALYALDWTFGTIWAIHLKPDGAGYVGEKEEFITGSPLPVTDAIIGDDGALYFTVGGRGTQSGLYRVTYVGHEPTAPATHIQDQESAHARATRRSLEAFHGKKDPQATRAAWPFLGNDDRYLRYAARLAIEAQPVTEWRQQALHESNPLARAVGIIALARTDTEKSPEAAVESLLEIPLTEQNETTILAVLRAYALSFIRSGKPEVDLTQKVIDTLDPLLPSSSDNINAELLRLLVYLDAPSAVSKGLDLIGSDREQAIPDWSRVIARNGGYGGTIRRMLDNPPPTREIEYALMLRNLRFGWNLEQRRRYHTFINQAAKRPGGASFAGFLKNIRKDALANTSEADRMALTDLTGESLEPPSPLDIKPPKGPGRNWTVTDAIETLSREMEKGADFKSGQNLFHATACAACHRFDGQGGSVGPDLTSVRNKFSVSDLLESIIQPSKVISDQYGSKVVRLKDGTTHTGLVIDRIVDQRNIVEIYTQDHNAAPMIVDRRQVASIKESPISQMPAGLINGLNGNEMTDLVAYLMSRGNPEDSVFKD